MKLRIELEGQSYDVKVEFLDDAIAPAAGHSREAVIPIPELVTRERPPQKLPEDRYCRCPITGKVVTLIASSGDRVKKNQTVVVLEAMKMEINIGPAVDGVVETIHVKPGDMVKSGEVLFELS